MICDTLVIVYRLMHIILYLLVFCFSCICWLVHNSFVCLMVRLLWSQPVSMFRRSSPLANVACKWNYVSIKSKCSIADVDKSENNIPVLLDVKLGMLQMSGRALRMMELAMEYVKIMNHDTWAPSQKGLPLIGNKVDRLRCEATKEKIKYIWREQERFFWMSLLDVE